MAEGSAGDVKRVVVWSTGGIGSLSIVAVNERPDLELVGVWVHSEEKVGRDAGELANGVADRRGRRPTTSTRCSPSKPDCVIYGASGPDRDAGAVPDYERILAAGINVVTTTSTTLINPLAYVPAHRERLEAAAEHRRDLDLRVGHRARLPVRPAAGHPRRRASRSISKIHCHEIALYDDYGVEEIMIDALGFGQPLDFEPWIMLPGAIAGEFEGQVRFIADGLGVEVDEIRETYDRRLTEQPIETAFGTVEPGTCGAIRFQAIGVVDGREAIVIDHITRLARHVGTDWPIGEHDLSYRIVIEGKPNFDCWVTPTLDDPAEAGIADHGQRSRRDARHRDAGRERRPLRRRRRARAAAVAGDADHRPPARLPRLTEMFTLRFDMRAPDWGAPIEDLYAAAIEMAAWAEDRGARGRRPVRAPRHRRPPPAVAVRPRLGDRGPHRRRCRSWSRRPCCRSTSRSASPRTSRCSTSSAAAGWPTCSASVTARRSSSTSASS